MEYRENNPCNAALLHINSLYTTVPLLKSSRANKGRIVFNEVSVRTYKEGVTGAYNQYMYDK